MFSFGYMLLAKIYIGIDRICISFFQSMLLYRSVLNWRNILQELSEILDVC